jgi:hypothetical protein
MLLGAIFLVLSGPDRASLDAVIHGKDRQLDP